MGILSQQVGDAASSIRAVFRNPGLRKINLAFAGSVVGDWAYGVALAVYVYTEGGATAVGVLGVIRYVSMALVLPLASSFADKMDRRRVMITSDLLRMALVIVAGVVIVSDGSPYIVYGLAVLTALAGTPFRSSQASLLPRLADHPEELTAANVTSSTIESVGFFIGPALAGILLAVTNVETVYWFDAATFGWSMFMVATIKVPERAVEAPPTTAPGGNDDAPAKSDEHRGVLAGYRLIFRRREIRLLVGIYVAQTIVAGASLVFQVAIALDMLELGESGLGLLNSVLGVGGLLGGITALLLATRNKLAADFGIGVLLWAMPLLLVVAWPTLWAAAVAMLIIGLANSIVDVNAYTILQRLVPDEVMSRVFGAMESALIAGMALGALAMPILINTVGLRTGLLILGAGISVMVVAVSPGLRRIDSVSLVPEGFALLRTVPFLSPLPRRTLEELARSSVRREVPAGTVVVAEGAVGDRFYAIESGSFEVTIGGDHIRRLGAGDFFGEIALLRDIPRTATITALTDAVVRTLERDEFLPAVTGHGEASEGAEQVVSRLLSLG